MTGLLTENWNDWWRQQFSNPAAWATLLQCILYAALHITG